MHLSIAHLYPHTMNTYGDDGNIICLTRRCAWRDIITTVHPIDVGDDIPEAVDIYFFGGGQDAAQSSLVTDLHKKAERLHADVDSGTPLLAVCGGYQLLGNAYQPSNADRLLGISIFPIETYASETRMIGNVVITATSELGFSKDHQTLVGFENHSGKTQYTQENTSHPLGIVRHGFGNNGKDHTEGCIVNNAIGCYLHGPLLPKNPHLADWLIQKACSRHDNSYELKLLDDALEWTTHEAIVGRYV
jgi:CobQ-like glutamine amidotransferase family enzyme